MPNHITNVLHFHCSDERFSEIAEFLRVEGEPIGTVDFNKSIPMPKELEIEAGSTGETGLRVYRQYRKAVSQIDPPMAEADAVALEKQYRADIGEEAWELGKAYYDNIQKYGAPTWYEWRCKHWGTKWNAYDCVTDMEPSEHTLSFFTAWSSVAPIVKAVSARFKEVDILYRWADEDIGHNVGEALYRDGDTVWENLPYGGSKEAIEMAADIMEADVSDWNLRLSDDGLSYEFFRPDESFLPEEDPITEEER